MLNEDTLTLLGLDKTESYPLVDEAGISYSPSLNRHVFNLVEKGNQEFRESHFEKAITFYSEAISLKPEDPILHANRSVAYINFCQKQKQFPSKSLFDPENLSSSDYSLLGQLALYDAEKLLNFQTNSVKPYNAKVKPYNAKVGALILLDRYEAARTILLGQQFDPSSDCVQSLLQELEKVIPNSLRKTREKTKLSKEFDCSICFSLLYEPVTTSCGHTYCQPCISHAMDFGNKCSQCRQEIIYLNRAFQVSVELKNFILENFPAEYAKRKLEHDSSINFDDGTMPFFVKVAPHVIIPGMKLSLGIIVPKQRLMVRRMMEGNRMGIVGLDSTQQLSRLKLACEFEIKRCDIHPNGSMKVEIESYRRCRIRKASTDKNGNHVAEVEWIMDRPLQSGQDKAIELWKRADVSVGTYLENAKKKAREERNYFKLEKYLNLESRRPSHQDLERFSFWFGGLACKAEKRLDLFQIRDTSQRLTVALNALRRG